jgi:uncharacterized protein
MQYTLSEIQALHKKYAPCDEVYNLVFIHCQIVCDIAEQLITNGTFHVNVELVRTGCLLHDVGVHPLFGADGKQRSDINYITHGTEGEAILRAEGFPEAIWRFCSHHTGVGLTKEDVIKQNLPLPVTDYLADTDEELLIMYADKFHSKTTPPYFNSFEWYKQDVARFGADKVLRFEKMAEKFGIPNLEPLAKKYGYEIRDYNPADVASVN